MYWFDTPYSSSYYVKFFLQDRKKKNKDGSLTLIIEFTAYESLYNMKKESKRVLFESDSEEKKEEEKEEENKEEKEEKKEEK